MSRSSTRTFTVAVVAVAALAAGCSGGGESGGTSATSAVAATTTASTADSEAAYEQYIASLDAFDCDTSYGDLTTLNLEQDVDGVHDAAREYRGLLESWDSAVKAIDFPAVASDSVQELLSINADEIAHLDAAIAATEPLEVDDALRLVFLDEARAFVAGDELREALGHPIDPAYVTLDQVELARATFQVDVIGVAGQFSQAVEDGDLAAATAANEVEIAALRTYRDAVDAMEFPDEVADLVEELKAKIDALIEYDERQVDVASAEDIVNEPEGSAEGKEMDEAYDALADGLVALVVEEPDAGVDTQC